MSWTPKGGITWKSAKARLPRTRAVYNILKNPRILLSIVLVGGIVLLWRGLSGTAEEMQRFYCFGPPKSPMQMTPNEQAQWAAHLQTPVIIHNHHAEIEVNSTKI